MTKTAGKDSSSITLKLPQDFLSELQLRVPEGERSEFIRQAILEKLNTIPRADKILALEKQLQRLEEDLAAIKKALAEYDLLPHESHQVTPYIFCRDETDEAIIDYLMQQQGATTAEISNALKRNRWLILNRLKKIQKLSERKLGRPLVEFLALQRMGKKRAWWFNKDLIPQNPK